MVELEEDENLGSMFTEGVAFGVDDVSSCEHLVLAARAVLPRVAAARCDSVACDLRLATVAFIMPCATC